ncbi:MAG: creatininase family protein [Rhodobacteraceae bacterium]|nr:creatininase family protein [Paracoccaceae bacterium]
MRLDHMTWRGIERRLNEGACVMVPVGSTEQHGPMGRLGTDTICAEAVALAAAARCGAIVAPALAYTPAPFNTAFAGTVSVSAETFGRLAHEVFSGLLSQGFAGVLAVNGHGANLAPLAEVQAACPAGAVEILSWWAPEPVMALREALFGDWEGMHATPSEIAITQTLLGALPPEDAAAPPRALSPAYIAAHAGDRHGAPDAHRADFPDGRVGSHSALATPEHGARLLDTAGAAVACAFAAFQARQLGHATD